MKRTTLLGAGAAILVTLANIAAAQDTDGAAGETTNARAKARTEAAELRARRLKANAEAITAMGLPSYNGQTTTEGDNAGRLEAGLLSTQAVGSAAQAIVGSLPTNRSYIVLSGDEDFDLGIVGTIRSQMDALKLQFQRILPQAPPRPTLIGPDRSSPQFMTEMTEGVALSGATGAIGLATTVLGALRSQTTLRGIAEVGVSDQLLARAVTARLGRWAVLPNAPRLAPQNSALQRDFLEIAMLRDQAELLRRSLEGNDAQKALLEQVKLALTRYDAFFAFATEPDDNGVMPIARAIMLDAIMSGDSKPHILRVDVDLSGGTMINTTNIGSYLGLDPVRISGGLVASYVATDVTDGTIVKAGVVACMTGQVRLRRVHDGTWRRIAPNRASGTEDCVAVAATG